MKSSAHAKGLENKPRKKRGAGFTQLLPWLPYPPPEYFAKLKSYCISINAWQAAVVITGALPLDPGLNRITPSSVAQKLRTPEMLKLCGEAPVTNELLIPLAAIPVEPNVYPLLAPVAPPANDCASTQSIRQAFTCEGPPPPQPAAVGGPRSARAVAYQTVG